MNNVVFSEINSSFFSATITEDLMVLHGDTVNFDVASVNYGGDFIVSGSVYVYVLTLISAANAAIVTKSSVEVFRK